MSKCFPLSCRGQVAAALSLSLVCASRLWAEGIVAAPDAGVTVSASPGGATVVEIARPGESGLSHNRFTDYNVGAAGAVLNNAIRAGSSQLAGALGANAQLAGRPAAVILNEVVSNNPSLLLGRQEIFGKAADFVLANPNGITCNGCGFINTPRATLAVGTPQLLQGQLQTLLTAEGATTLAIGPAGLLAEGALDLIAPRVDAQGALVAVSGINAISGHNEVSYPTRKIRSNGAGTTHVDSAYLGGMRADRISIVNTDAGAGINLRGTMAGTSLLRVVSQGKIALEAAELKGAHMLIVGDAVDARARMTTTSREHASHDESWFIWRTGAEALLTRETGSHAARNSLEGEHVRIKARHDIQLAATDVTGENIRLVADNILLAGATEQDLTRREYDVWKNSWSRHEFSEHDNQTQAATTLNARNNISMAAQGSIELAGAVLNAGNDTMFNAGENINLAGLIEQEMRVERGNRHLEGAALASGVWDRRDETQRLKTTALAAGHRITLDAANNLGMQGARLSAGDNIALHAGGRVEVSGQVLQQQHWQGDRDEQWGGLAGSTRQDALERKQVNVGSALVAQGALSVRANDDIRIVGSQVCGARGARAETRRGDLKIEHATDLRETLLGERQGGVFDITLRQHFDSREQQQVQGTALASESNLQLASGRDVALTGSRLQAAGDAGVTAAGSLRVSGASLTQHVRSDDLALGWQTDAGQDARHPALYRAGTGLTVVGSAARLDDVAYQGAAIEAGAVTLRAQGELSVEGSRIEARNGDVALTGTTVALVDGHCAVHSESQSRRGRYGVYAAAGFERARVGIDPQGQSEQALLDSQSARGSRIDAAGDLTLDAGAGRIVSRGATLNAGGALSLNAGEIENLASSGENHEVRDAVHWGVDVAANAEFGALLKPAELLVSTVQSGNLLASLVDAGKLAGEMKENLEQAATGGWGGLSAKLEERGGAPSIGGIARVEGNHHASSTHDQSRQASQFTGASVQVASLGRVSDQGSRYQATGGAVRLAAAELVNAAAVAASESTNARQEWALGLKLATSTGQDLDLDLSLAGGAEEGWRNGRQASAGAIVASDGVQLAVAGQARFEGTRIDAGQGALALRGGEVQLAAAQTAVQSGERQRNGAIELSLKTQPTVENIQSVGGSGKVAMELGRGSAQHTGADVAQLNGRTVTLAATGGLALSGTRIGAPDGGARPQQVTLSAGGAIDIGAAVQTSHRQGTSGGGELAVNARLGSGTGGGFGLKLDDRVATRDNLRQASIDGGEVTLVSGADLRLDGAALTAARIDGRVGGDLHVASRNAQERDRTIAVDVGLSTPDLDKMLSSEGMTLRARGAYHNETLAAATQQSGMVAAQQIGLTVSGTTRLSGARVEAAGRAVLPAGAVTAPLPGQSGSSDFGIDVNGTPLDIARQAGRDWLSGNRPLGLRYETVQQDRLLTSSAR